MKTTKEFDCVKMKNAIQARLVARRSGMSPSKFIADLETSVMKSTDPIGEYWRRLGPKRISSVHSHHALAGR